MATPRGARHIERPHGEQLGHADLVRPHPADVCVNSFDPLWLMVAFLPRAG